jgi:hypothetical protein
MPYRAPLADRFLLSQVLGFDRWPHPRFADATPDTARAVLPRPRAVRNTCWPR